jgi:hypothetical protein
MAGWKSGRNQMMERRGAMYSPPAAKAPGEKRGWSDEARKKAAESKRAKSHHAAESHMNGGGGFLNRSD